MSEHGAYELYQEGNQLFNDGQFAAAIASLSRARDLEPTAAMIRETLGRALLKVGRFRESAEEFHVLVGWEPVNDYALFCYGRALQLSGNHTEARAPLTMAALLNPERDDYQVYRDKAIAQTSNSG